MSLSPQDYVGRYRLLNLIRAGKTCQVWEVINDLAGERFAIKLLLAAFRRDRVEVGYLRHEHNVGCKLHHQRVIKIHEFGVDRDNVFLAMELCPSPNIKQIVQQSYDALVPNMRSCIEQAAEGLAYFHSQGWVHRDIKPDNYLMKSNGDVKLIDFALAQRSDGLLSRLNPFRSRRIQGTRSYMSPEQIRGERLDQRADIYSFGCMVYELLTGKLPFTGVSTNDLLMKHIRAAPPSLQSLNRNVTDSMVHLVKRMMAKVPAGRPVEMAEFLREFRDLELFKEPPATARRG